MAFCTALSVFHAFSGSDYTTSLNQKGKIRPFKLLVFNKCFQNCMIRDRIKQFRIVNYESFLICSESNTILLQLQGKTFLLPFFFLFWFLLWMWVFGWFTFFRCKEQREQHKVCCWRRKIKQIFRRNHTILFVRLRGRAQEYLLRSYQSLHS